MRFLIKIIFIVLFASAQAFAGNMEAKDKNALSSQASNQLVREATNLNENKVPFMLAAKEESYFYVFSQNGETAHTHTHTHTHTHGCLLRS